MPSRSPIGDDCRATTLVDTGKTSPLRNEWPALRPAGGHETLLYTDVASIDSTRSF